MSVEWTPTPQHSLPHTHRDTETLYQHLVLAMAFVTGVTHSNSKPARPPQHPARPPARAPILQTSQCTHNTQQSWHRCPRDRHSGQSSPGTQQQHPPVQLRAGNRVLFRVGGTPGRWGARTTPTDSTARGEGELGLAGLCQHGEHCAEPTPGSAGTRLGQRSPCGWHEAQAAVPPWAQLASPACPCHCVKLDCSSLKAAFLCFSSSACFFFSSCSALISSSNLLASLMACACA